MPSEIDKMRDYFEWCSSGASKFVTSSFIKGRRIAFYGIGMAMTQYGKKLEMNPVFPCMGPLMKLVKANPKCNAYRWSGKRWNCLKESQNANR